MKHIILLSLMLAPFMVYAQSDSADRIDPLPCQTYYSNDSTLRDSMTQDQILQINSLYAEVCAYSSLGKMPFESCQLIIAPIEGPASIILVRRNKIDPQGKIAFEALKPGDRIVIERITVQADSSTLRLPAHVITVVD